MTRLRRHRRRYRLGAFRTPTGGPDLRGGAFNDGWTVTIRPSLVPRDSLLAGHPGVDRIEGASLGAGGGSSDGVAAGDEVAAGRRGGGVPSADVRDGPGFGVAPARAGPLQVVRQPTARRRGRLLLGRRAGRGRPGEVPTSGMDWGSAWRRRGRGPCRWPGSRLTCGGAAFCWVVAQVGADPERHLGVPPPSTVAGRDGPAVVLVEGAGGERRGPHCSCRQEVAPDGRRPPRGWCRRRRLRQADLRTGEVLRGGVALGRPTPTVSSRTRPAPRRRCRHQRLRPVDVGRRGGGAVPRCRGVGAASEVAPRVQRQMDQTGACTLAPLGSMPPQVIWTLTASRGRAVARAEGARTAWRLATRSQLSAEVEVVPGADGRDGLGFGVAPWWPGADARWCRSRGQVASGGGRTVRVGRR
jgi:hypothetical protein